MNRAVYKYLMSTYGSAPGIWFAFVMQAISVFIIRVYVVVVMAQVTSNVVSGDTAAAKRHLLIFLLAYIGGAIIGSVGELVGMRTENSTYYNLHRKFHGRMIEKDMSFFRDNQTGYLVSSYRQHLDSVIILIRLLRTEVLATVISLTAPVAVLFFANAKVGFIALAIIVVQIAYVLWSSHKADKYRHLTHELYRKTTAEVSDEITNIVAFKSSGVESQAKKRLAALSHAESHAYWQRRRIAALLDLPRSITTSIGISLAIYVVVSGASAHDPKSLGMIVLVLTYMFQIVRNVAVLPELITNHDDLVTKMYPTLKYLTTEDEVIRDPAKPKPLAITKGAIRINKVTFSYESTHHKIFDGLSISIAGGERVGVVGLSGAGKSTLANLLLRFDEVDDGSIEIDGIDIRSVRQSELRQKIAYVPQEPLLFHRSVRENIAYYDDEATDKQIIKVAKAAHAHEFIQKLPHGYDTLVGERGIKLSGGQKQRVAIARALLKNAPILLFDEATSALDSESEQIIQNALPEIMGKRTAMVVAHRLSTVAGLDRIIVMHDGKVEEQGTHAELLKRKGRYYALWQKQTRTESGV
ncbi:MAG: hypothetical protein JWO41_240 [Candidatus Saccharibacteria bacterium]|nr:hypothetical protein [Candidatus Saccharibacteria bacterium]